MIRLNKLLSQRGVSSRRMADDLIAQGRVDINGRVVTELGTKVDPDRDDIRVDGRRLARPAARRYLLLDKPRGVVSTRTDPQRRPTVIDLVAKLGISGYLYPVGRLDYDSEGLLLLTNDGDFAERVTHPRYEQSRTYEAHVAGVPDARDLERLSRGLEIDGQRTRPADVRLLRVNDTRDGAEAVIELTLREGRNRQVRRMCDAIAHPVTRLRRTRIGAISDRGLRPGQIRDLTAAEVASLLEGGQTPGAGRPARRPESTLSNRPHRATSPGRTRAPGAETPASPARGAVRTGPRQSARGPKAAAPGGPKPKGSGKGRERALPKAHKPPRVPKGRRRP